MIISVVICAYTLDRWDTLTEAVRSSIMQTCVPLEILLVIDHNDELLERASNEFIEVKVLANQFEKGLSGARNTGVINSSGDVVVFLDDDAWAEPDWLEKLVSPMKDDDVAGTGGWIVPNWEFERSPWLPESFYWILGCSYTGLPADGDSIRNPIGASMALRRRVFASVGGFTSGIGRIGVTPLGCEETELCIRYAAQYPDERFVLARNSVVHHFVPSSRLTWKYFWTRCWAEGLSKAAVSSLSGAESGLASERRHVLTQLPREIIQNAQLFTRNPRAALVRSALIVAGTALAAAGFVWGSFMLMRAPLVPDNDVFSGRDSPRISDRSHEGPEVAKHRLEEVPAPRGVTRGGVGWRPVILLQVDVDSLDGAANAEVTPGDRVWIEAVKNGQMVGLVETDVGANGLELASLTRLLGSYTAASSSDQVVDVELPTATVVIPTICRHPEELVRTVKSILDADYPDFEIVIVDNRCDETRAGFPDFSAEPKVRVVQESHRGVSSARNRGIEEATGDFVAFVDDDILVDRNWLRVIGTRFALSPEVEAIGGLIRPIELRTPAQLWFEEFYGGFSRTYHSEIMSIERLGGTDALFPYAPGRFGSGGNMAFRLATLHRIGGFNTLLGTGTPARGGEDPEIFLEILINGGTTAFEPAALVRHAHHETQADFFDQVFGYGVGLTAMYTAMIVRDPKHLNEMARRVPAGLKLLFKPRHDRSPSRTPSYPKRTLVYQVLGMLYGPLAYFRSALSQRKARNDGAHFLGTVT